MSLSFLLMLIAALQSSELLFGIILMLYAVLGLYVLLLYQLYAAHDQSKQERRAAVPEGVRVLPSTKPILGRYPSVQFRALVIAIGTAGFMLSVAAFMAFPRGFGYASFGEAGRFGSRSTTGFVDQVDLLRGGRITESRREVMRVQLVDQNGRAIRWPVPLLLKGAALDRYEGAGRWSRTERPKHQIHADNENFRPIPARMMLEDEPTVMQVRVLNDARTIFSAHRAVGIMIDPPQAALVDPTTGVMELDRHGPSVRSYALQFTTESHRYRTSGTDDDSIWRESLSELRNERVAELAREILRNAGLPERKPGHREAESWEWNQRAVQAFVQYLQSYRFTYDLDLSHIVVRMTDGSPDDPIVQFLLEHRRGHCEYFASALMALCFNSDIEARLITGYVAAAYDEANARYNILELNAHAWVEARIGQAEWRTYDPTPPHVFRNLHAPPASVADQLRWFYDRFDMAWNRTVVSYDSRTQHQLAERWDLGLADRGHAAVERLKTWLSELNRMFLLGPAGYIWMGLMGVVFVLAAVVFVQLLRRLMTLREVLRLRHVHGREYQRMLLQLGFYLDMLRVLERAAMPKPAWLPPLRYAEQLAESHPDEASIVRRVTESFYRARYGHAPLATDELRELRGSVRVLAERLGVKV
jgi:protein-glutamine gamma-glutamyltransferase